MTDTKTPFTASDAMMKVLADWGVKRIYGLPGGSFDSTMNAIHNFRDQIDYIGVRHEEFGALAAVAEGKWTGHIGVAFGSAGPGAAHLINALYDAKTDGIPTLALIGQVPTSRMNMDYFQEMPENPMFADVAVYNRTVMTAEQLPSVVDHAIRTAYEKKGVAVVVIPKDLGWTEIPDTYVSSAGKYTPAEWRRPARPEDVERVLDLLEQAERPVVYFGRGMEGAGDDLAELARLLRLPAPGSYLSKGILDEDLEFAMLSTGRVATKPGVDVARAADFVLFLGTNFEFPAFARDAKFVDVNLSPSVIGARHNTELGILADAPEFTRQLIAAAKARYGEEGSAQNHQGWYDAAVEDKKQWAAWVDARAERDTAADAEPIGFEAIYKQINAVADDDALFGVDVGNINIAVARFLGLNGERRQSTSPLYATMGYGLPAATAAALEYPGRQVWSLSGDGGMAMVIPSIIAQVEHHLPVINVVFTNKSLGFIEAEQDDTHQPHSGVGLSDVDFATVAEGFGVTGITVRKASELSDALSRAKEITAEGKPVLIDVKITNDRLLPVEQFPHNRTDAGRAEGIYGTLGYDQFVKLFEAEDLEPFGEILARHI
nr:pyruvate oxidase [Corynebacterium lactis]